MSTDVHTLAEQARAMGYSDRKRVVNRLERFLIRNESYLKRRAARGTHTSHDDTLAEDCAVVSLVLTWLQEGKL
jgi:hypothetical protein